MRKQKNTWKQMRFIQINPTMISSNKELKLEDATVVHEDPVGVVEQLKKNPDTTVWGGWWWHIIKPLIEHQLIDEWYIQIAPVLLGNGIRLFSRRKV